MLQTAAPDGAAEGASGADLQAVTFSIQRGAAQPDLAGASPAQPVPNVSPAAGEQ